LKLLSASYFSHESTAPISVNEETFIFQAGAACAVRSAHLRALTYSISTGASKGSCSDAITVPIGDWLFYLEGGTYSAIKSMVYPILYFYLVP